MQNKTKNETYQVLKVLRGRKIMDRKKKWKENEKRGINKNKEGNILNPC